MIGYKITNFEKILIAEFILYGLMVWNTMGMNETVVSACLSITFIGVVAMIFCANPNNDEYLLMQNTIILLSFVSVIVSCVSHSIFPDFQTLVNFICFSTVIIFMRQLALSSINYYSAKIILWIGIIVAALYPLAFYYFNVGEDLMGYFTLNFSNPNLAGMFLLQGIIYCILGLFIVRNKIVRLLFIVLIIQDFLLLLLTEARNCVLTLVFMGVVFVFMFRRKMKAIPNSILKLVSIFPLMFLVLYLNFITKFSMDFQDDTFFNHEGKNVESRVDIWTQKLQDLGGNFLFGDYIPLQGNAHNSLLAVYISFGLLVLVLTIVYTYKIMKHVNSKNLSTEQQICLISFAATIVMGMAEGALYCGSIGLFIPACTYLAFANVKWNNN